MHFFLAFFYFIIFVPLFIAFVDTQWRWTLLTFGLSFILSWLFFAVIWWLIAFTHGDFEEAHLPDNQAESGWEL